MRIYWDQILVNTFAGAADHKLHRLSPLSADLRYAGFPREYSPDGKRPLIYDYDWIDPVAPWKSHAGDYTRFGDVTPLLGSRDDQYVIMRNGDEIQIDFAAASCRLCQQAGSGRSSFMQMGLERIWTCIPLHLTP